MEIANTGHSAKAQMHTEKQNKSSEYSLARSIHVTHHMSRHTSHQTTPHLKHIKHVKKYLFMYCSYFRCPT